MEREDRAPVGTFYAPGAWEPTDRVELDESAAHHAAVKRLVIGDIVRLSNGQGRRALAEIVDRSKRRLVVTIADAPVDEIYIWASIAGMPEEMVAEEIRTIATKLKPLLA